MRRFTSLFKALLKVGFRHDTFIADSWAVVRSAAQAQLDATKQPGLANSIAFIDKIVGLVVVLPAPKDGDVDEDEAEQQELIAAEKPGTEGA